jgi:hypothetical protein
VGTAGGTVPSKVLGAGDGDAYISPSISKSSLYFQPFVLGCHCLIAGCRAQTKVTIKKIKEA